MKPVFVESIGVVTEGIVSWADARNKFTGVDAYTPAPIPRYKPQLLPANERRRATEMVRLAFNVCEQAVNASDISAKSMGSVFASSGGDYHVLDQISKTLATPEKMVSPTQFHNSVHNSASGYWGIASESQAASSSISSFDTSFFSGMLEAAIQVTTTEEPILLAVYDSAPPFPLNLKRKINTPFACCFLLTPEKIQGSISQLELSMAPYGKSETQLDSLVFESLRLDNPAARALPVLMAIANQKNEVVYINGPGDQQLKIRISAC